MAEYSKVSLRDYDEVDDEERLLSDVTTTIPLSAIHVIHDADHNDHQSDTSGTNSNAAGGKKSVTFGGISSSTPSSPRHSSRYPRNAMIRHDFPTAISRIPTEPRDWVYGAAFLTHFLGIILLSVIEKVSLHHSSINYQHAGSWASIIMIITLLGGFLGAMITVYQLNSEDKSLLFMYTLPFALILKILLGNTLLIMRSMYSLIGIIVLVSAFWDSFRYKHAKSSLSFTATVMDMVSRVFVTYGTSLSVFCAIVVFAQTCVLLWWGAFFTGLISTIDALYILPTSILMLFSLYWITEFFHHMMSFVIGGCTLWLFVRDDIDISSSSSEGNSGVNEYSDDNSGMSTQSTLSRPVNSDERDRLTSKLIFYIQCSLSSSFGSISKASLLLPTIGILRQIRYTMQQRHNQLQSSVFCCCIPWAYFDYLCCGGMSNDDSISMNSSHGSSHDRLFYSPRHRVGDNSSNGHMDRLNSYYNTNSNENSNNSGENCWLCCCCLCCCRGSRVIHNYNRLSMPLLAVYGRTLTRTVEDQLVYHPETLATSLEDFTAYTVQALITTMAAICSVSFALTADSKEGSTWPLFLIVCFIVFYSAFSLSMSVFPSCVDALIISAAINPERFAKENQLVLLRFFRTSEIEMR